MSGATRALRALARLHGVQATYTDGTKQRRRASDEAVVAVLRAGGIPIDEPDQAHGALRAAVHEGWTRVCEPVAVVWLGEGGATAVRAPAGVDAVEVEVALDDGTTRGWRAELAGLAVDDEAEIEGVAYAARALPLPRDLPAGYHRLRVTAGGRSGEALLVAAPPRAYETATETWGVFAPLYALRSARNPGIGTLSDLRALLGFVADRGGGVVATLPLLASFTDETSDPSPYSPASRLWWNELHLDLDAVPEIAASERAQDLLASPGFRDEIEVARKSDHVEYARLAPLMRRVLGVCADALTPQRRAALAGFVAEHPAVEEYARFRAATERHGSWRGWDGASHETPAHDDAARAYHAYAQFLMHEQLEAIRADALARDAGLYLDLPLGTHPDGFDVWRHRDLFAVGVAGGAPPDNFFTKGQNWVFPPMIPARARATGYAYPIACLRTLLRYATVLRIDHVIGLHRLFWIPDGFAATDGVFVRWPDPGEWYAILSLESHRAQASVIGEDLGTVPRAVRAAMAARNVMRSWVLQEEFRDDDAKPVNPAPARALAAVNTHDMPPFASWWGEHDIAERIARGLMTEAEARRERKERARRRARLVDFLEARGFPAREDPLGAALAWIADGRARIVVAALEDLWDEIEPQNRPGTTTEHPNWRRKARVPLEDLAGTPQVTTRLEVIAERRGRRRSR